MGTGDRGPARLGKDRKTRRMLGPLPAVDMPWGYGIAGLAHPGPARAPLAAILLGMLAATLGVCAVRARAIVAGTGTGRASADIVAWIPGLGWALLLAGAAVQGGLLIAFSGMAWAGIRGLLTPDDGVGISSGHGHEGR